MKDDAISRQAAIEGSKELFALGGCYCDEHSIVGMLNSLPSTEPERKWVPLDSGRFPDDSGTYIVTAYDGAKERVTFAKYQKRLKRWELTGARAYWRVLAWMSLPTPYEERREE